MKKTSKTIVFFGNERLATGVTTTVTVLQSLVAAGYQVAAVVVAQTEAQASRQTRQLEIAEVAEKLGVPVLRPATPTELDSQLSAYNADIGVLVAYGKLVPTSIIDLFPAGIVNIHPSLLPKHRGPIPLESVILNGEPETGVSLMKLVEKMDAGPVYGQQTVALRGDETKQALADQLLSIGKDMLLACLPGILDGSLEPAAQDDGQATYDERLDKADSELEFTKPAAQLERQIRAYAGWPRSRAKLGTTEVIITKAHVSDITGTPGTLWLEDRQLGIHAGEGTLIIDQLIPSGKKEMAAEAFLAGYTL